MTLLKAFILSLIQGITEFFPVSSSAHLQLTRSFLHIRDDNCIFFDLICHMGTLLALILFLRKDIVAVFFDRRKILLFFFALLPLPFMYVLFKFLCQDFYRSAPIGLFLAFTGVVLLGSIFLKRKKPSRKIPDVLCIGVMQSLALMPGVSRSGMTISAALYRGWEVNDAIRFSFLLAIPTILGGFGMELLKADFSAMLPWYYYLLGFCTSFLTGLVFVRIIFSLTRRFQLLPFAIYCILLGSTLLFFTKTLP